MRTALSLTGLVIVIGLLGLSAPAQATHDASNVAIAATPAGDGYWTMSAHGDVGTFGLAPALGRFGDDDEEDPFGGCCRGLVATPSGQGLWAVKLGPPGVGGQVKTLGDAPFLGHLVADEAGEDADPESQCCRGLVATPSGGGLWGFRSDGKVWEVGDAPTALGNFPPDPGPYEAIARTPTGEGLWGVTLGGPGVGGHLHALGDATDFGDFATDDGEDPNGQCCRGLVATPRGDGLWALRGNGLVEQLGRAPDLGDFPPPAPNQPYTALAATPSGAGLWALTSAGGVRTLGDAQRFAAHSNFAQLAPTPAGDGYWLMTALGRVHNFGAAPNLGSFVAEEEDPNFGCCRGLVATPSGAGLWSVTLARGALGGQLRTLGDARPLGNFVSDDDADPTNQCCRGLVATQSGDGLWALSSSGAVQALGDAPALGSFPPELGHYAALARTPTGAGLWGVTVGPPGVGGHLHALGDATDFGDFATDDEGDPDNTCCRGLVATPSGTGLWALRGNGLVEQRGGAPDLGDLPPPSVGERYTALGGTPTGEGLWGLTNTGRVRTLGDAGFFGDLQGYPRPLSASPLRVSLVIAYAPCTASNRIHGPPLAHSSCSPPVQASQFLTVGTHDANGEPPKSVGSLRLGVAVGNPATPENEADFKIVHAFSDVRNKDDLSDYGGQLRLVLSARVTDKLNGPSATEAATVADLSFPVTVPCTLKPGTGGSDCNVTTSANTVLPGAVTERKRAIWALERVEVYDGGADGSATTTSDNTLFATQGVFVP